MYRTRDDGTIEWLTPEPATKTTESVNDDGLGLPPAERAARRLIEQARSARAGNRAFLAAGPAMQRTQAHEQVIALTHQVQALINLVLCDFDEDES